MSMGGTIGKLALDLKLGLLSSIARNCTMGGCYRWSEIFVNYLGNEVFKCWLVWEVTAIQVQSCDHFSRFSHLCPRDLK